MTRVASILWLPACAAGLVLAARAGTPGNQALHDAALGGDPHVWWTFGTDLGAAGQTLAADHYLRGACKMGARARSHPQPVPGFASLEEACDSGGWRLSDQVPPPPAVEVLDDTSVPGCAVLHAARDWIPLRGPDPLGTLALDVVPPPLHEWHRWYASFWARYEPELAALPALDPALAARPPDPLLHTATSSLLRYRERYEVQVAVACEVPLPRYPGRWMWSWASVQAGRPSGSGSSSSVGPLPR